MHFDNELEAAKEAAVLAGNAVMKIYNSRKETKTEYKEGHMPLTEADLASNSIITEYLTVRFPDHAFLSEEGKDDLDRLNHDLCFIVDPLDGTKEFLKRNGQFTVNIALSCHHKPVMGVIYVPVTKELYFSQAGKGSFYKNEWNEKFPLNVNKIPKSKKDLRVVMSSSHGCRQMELLINKYGLSNCIEMGSSLKGCMIAKGEADLYYRFNPTMEWDTAAMQCIVEEAGGIFRQMDDTCMEYNRRNSVNEKGFYIINDWSSRLEMIQS